MKHELPGLVLNWVAHPKCSSSQGAAPCHACAAAAGGAFQQSALCTADVLAHHKAVMAAYDLW